MIGSGRGVEVPLQTDLVPLPHEFAVVAIDDVLRGHALGVERTVIGVPCTSEPLTISTSLPTIR